MIRPDPQFFSKIKFSDDEITQYLLSAQRDLEIANKDGFHEVKFTYSYQALIKLGIYLLAKKLKVRVKSIPGHHVKILEMLSKILSNKEIYTIGNAMRLKRNHDFYKGGQNITKKEADDFCIFVNDVFYLLKQR